MTPGSRAPAVLRAVGWLALLVLASAALLSEPIWLQTLRNAVFDQFQRWQPRVWQDTAVRVVDLDEESLARVGQWPWPRNQLAQLVAQARAGHAAAIGFDVVFAEPDRTSPTVAARQWSLSGWQWEALADVPDHDTVFAQEIGRGGVVLGYSMLPIQAANANALRHASAPVPARFVQAGEQAAPFVPGFGGTVGAVASLAGHADGHGALTFLPDSDGVVRRVPLLLRTGEQLRPTLVTEMLRVGQGQGNIMVRSAPDGLQEIRVGAIAVPTTGSGELWVHYAPPVAERSIPAWKLLHGLVPRHALDGKLLLVGSSAQGLMDLRFGTLGHLVPGVEIHAQVLEQVLTDSLLSRPAWAHALEAVVLLVGGIAVGVLAMTTGPAIACAAVGVVLCALGGFAWSAFTDLRLLIDPLTPSLGIVLAFMGPSLVRYHGTEQRRRWISQAFSRYVSPNLVRHIVAHPEQLTLGGQRQVCSFVFTDVAGFTGLMEHIDPAAAVGLLNDYLEGMVSIVFRHQGTLDRIVGDGIAIMFSAPIAQTDHRERAVACAVELQRFANRFALEQRATGVPFGHTRIGVHSGEVIVGNFGGGTIFDYRALGDVVNTASRLEGVNRRLGTWLCLSEAVAGAAPSLPMRCAGRLVFKGRTQPVQVYQPANDGLDGPVDALAVARYAAAYELMALHDQRALAAFEELAQQGPAEPLVQLHLDRLRRGDAGDLMVLADK